MFIHLNPGYTYHVILLIISMVMDEITAAPFDQKKMNQLVKPCVRNVNNLGGGTRDERTKKHRLKRYVVQGSMWKKKQITWRIESYSNDLPHHVSRQLIKEAFDVWSSWIPLQLREKEKGKVDITISFVGGVHLPCKIRFNGKDGTIAHAFYPSRNDELAGDIHFNDSEDFTGYGKHGRSLAWIALHEIGHSLGLRHSSTYGAIMSPYYQSFYHGTKLSLTTDDIRGIQDIYGKPKG